jgi:hypothetical protein
MNTDYSGRSSRPAKLFSFGLLDGPAWNAISRTGRLTNLTARTDVAHFIQRAVRPARSPREGGASWLRRELSRTARLRQAGEIERFGLSRFATVFMNSPD